MVDDLTRQKLNRESRAFRKRLTEKMGMPVPDMYFDRHGKAIGLGDWTYLHSDTGYVRVAETRLDEAWISTVWTGHDMGLGFGPPIVFETMIFGGPLSDYQRRYHDEADALIGHLLAVALVDSVPLWRRLVWIVADSYREARDAGYRWPRFEAEPEPLWKVR